MGSDSAWRKLFIVLSEVFRYIGEGKRQVSDTAETLQLLISHNPQSFENLDINEHNVVQKIIAAIQLGKLKIKYSPVYYSDGKFTGYNKNGMAVFTFLARMETYFFNHTKLRIDDFVLIHHAQKREYTLNSKEKAFFSFLAKKISKEYKQKSLNELSENLA